jgi:hypothetical protein
VISHLIVLGLDLLDQQDQTGVVQRLAQIAQFLDIVDPTAVVPHHYYARSRIHKAPDLQSENRNGDDSVMQRRD